MHVIRNTFKKVAIGVSGGVDSAVSALLLKKQRFEVTGVFMKNWDDVEESGICSQNNDLQDAEWVCSKLDIPFKVVDFVKDYWNNVFVKFVEDYTKGFTPNPDILCNKHIKFSKFFEYASDCLECDAVSTGHYANSSFGTFLEFYKDNKTAHLLKAKDPMKDQTFFLCNIPQVALRRTMFPIGNFTKSNVKEIAEQNELNRILRRKESMGICFIGQRNFKEFISEYVPKNSGKFISIDSGKQIGIHTGVHHWAIGERYRIPGYPKRSYIIQKDSKTQDIYVAGGNDHPALFTTGLETYEPHWISVVPKQLIDSRNSVFECHFRFQHTHPLRKCTILCSLGRGLIVNFDKPLSSVSPGQFIVLYKDNECLGGAQIKSTGPSLFTLNSLNSVC